MPVAGLPLALDSAQEALLKKNAVSFWKISAEGRKTTVVLRLVTTTDPDVADFAHPNTATQHFGRKLPSQVRRDQRRPPNGQDKTQRFYLNQHYRQQQQLQHILKCSVRTTRNTCTTVTLTSTHVLHALLTTVHRQAVGPVTKTARRYHASASPWISLWKTT